MRLKVIAIFPSSELNFEETAWEVWEAGKPVYVGLSLAQAGEAARKLTITRGFQAMQRNEAAPIQEARPVRRGIYLSKEHKGKWEIWEDGVCVDTYDSVEAAAEDLPQHALKPTAAKVLGKDRI